MTNDDFSNRVIKSYEFRECVGAGGFGAVYRAFQPSVGREVAIKVILPHHANQPDFIRRFEVEAQLIARLEHPHIVPLYDYWRDPEGAFLVMRWLSGNLRSALRNGTWSVDASARLLDQIAAALTVAHREGVIHRDIKPDNILLDEDQNAYLADFGIAKDTNVGSITEEGALIGSPAYITPEQIKGEPITPRADIYSLGFVIYEMLIGTKPYADATTPIELISRHLNAPVPPLNADRSNLPAALNEVIQTATAKDPSHRYATMQRFAMAFRAALPNMQRAPAQPLTEPLTERELELLRLVVEGCSNAEIAERLVLTTGTVKWYINQIYAKLDVHSRRQAIERARQLNLVAIAVSSVMNTMLPVPDLSAAPLSSAVNVGRTEPTLIGSSELVNPYKGLRAFQESDAADFFGRAAMTERLLARLTDDGDGARFLAVAGPSGSGKSSVVRAGLIPALRRGALPNSARWFVTEMLPGTHPFEELEAALLRVSVSPIPGLQDQLAEDRRGLVRCAKRILPGDQDVELVLVIDQFEELFTLVDDEAVRAQFIDNLLSAATDPRSRIRIILTLRADFYDRPLNYPRLAELMRSHTEIGLPLTTNELERAITAPAERVGLRFEPGLVAAMIADVSTQPGALPLLQYALTELFERRKDLTLTLDTYRDSGGLAGALARRADDLFDDLEAEGQAAARQIFLRMVTLGEGTEDTRRRVLQSELASGMGEIRAIEEVLALYGTYRLLTFDRDLVTRGPTVEIAHEALIREWSRLRTWLDDNRDDMHIHRRLMASAREWIRSNQDVSFLASGIRLSQFEALSQSNLALNQLELEYLRVSILQREVHEVEKAARQAHELELARQSTAAQRRAANRLRYLVMWLGVFLVVVAALSAFAFRSRAEALKDLARSDVLRLASDAINLMQSDSDPELAALLAVRSIRTQYSFEGDLAIQQAATLNYPKQIGNMNGVGSVAYSPDGKYILVARTGEPSRLLDAVTGTELLKLDVRAWSGSFSPDSKQVLMAGGVVTVWDTKTGKQTGFLNSGGGFWGTGIFSPDGKYILTGGYGSAGAYPPNGVGIATLWDAQTGKELRKFEGHQGWVWEVAFSPDGKTVLTGSWDATVRLWDVQTGHQLHEFTGHTGYVYSVAFSPDGKYIVSSSADATARLWDAQTGQEIHRFVGLGGDVLSAGFSPDGKYLLTGARTLKLWDATTYIELRHYPSKIAYQSSSTVFSPDGKNIVIVNSDGIAEKWPVQPDTQLPIFSGHLGAVSSATFSPDGKYVFTGSQDGTARLWDAQTGVESRKFVSASVHSTAISPDGRYLLTGDDDNTARLYDTQSDAVLSFTGHKFGVHSVAFSPDGNYVLTGSWDGTARLWSAATAAIQCLFDGQTEHIWSVAFSPDSKYVLTGGDDNTARLWSVAGCNEIRKFTGHKGAVHSVAFSPDGKYVLTGSWDKTARLWDAQTGLELREYTGHTSYVNSVAFSPDGKYILTGSQDKTARLWDAETGDDLRHFGQAGGVLSVSFSRDGLHILTSSEDGTARIWDISTDDIIRFVCSQVTRDFTDDERTQFGINDTSPTCPEFGTLGTPIH